MWKDVTNLGAQNRDKWKSVVRGPTMLRNGKDWGLEISLSGIARDSPSHIMLIEGIRLFMIRAEDLDQHLFYVVFFCPIVRDRQSSVVRRGILLWPLSLGD